MGKATISDLQAPFPWFGGKSRVAHLVWERFGDVRNYVEPFAGSLAVLLARPTPYAGVETVNDLDGFIANFWRATAHDPAAVANYADWPVNENDLNARHIWLVNRRSELTARLEGDPEYYDAKIAGWWVWGLCCWIGGGWCSGSGPWSLVDGKLALGAGRGVNRKRPHLGNTGQGVKRQRPHLGNTGQGVKRQRPHLGDTGQGVNRQRDLIPWFEALAARLVRVRVCSGDWARVCGPSVTFKHGLTGVFLDPPYADTAKRAADLYAVDSESVAHDVREWAIDNGENPLMRIALCGYDGEHAMPESWECVPWKARGGYASNNNCAKERIWFSPHCLQTGDIFEHAGVKCE